MKKFVIDSSVFIAMILEDKNSGRAREFFKNAHRESFTFLAPSIFIYEIMMILLGAGVKLSDIESVLHLQLKSCLKIIELDEKLIKETEKLTKKVRAKSGFPSFYDSSYHALAIINDCDFVTLDEKHYEKAKHLKHIKLLKDL